VPAGLALIFAEYSYLQKRQDAHAAAWADQAVAAKVEEARAHMAGGDWDEAVRLLEEALATERATTSESVRPVLLEAQQGQAGAVLAEARAAIARKDAPRALALLRDYLSHPWAAETDWATLLRGEIERAVSDREALRRLGQMPDRELALFAADGQLAGGGGIRDDGVRAIFKDTLRRQLAREQVRRAARREAERLAAERRAEEQARQEARLRETPAYRDLAAFLADARKTYREQGDLAGKREKALAQLFRQLGVTDPAEQDKIRAGLADGRDVRVAEGAVARKGGQVKKAFRRAPDHDRADEEAFDRLVDRELDGLMRELKKP
jgi:hypothetical protein